MSNRRNSIYMLIIVCLVAGFVTGKSFFFNLVYVFVLLLIGAFFWSWAAVNWVRVGRQTPARRAQVGRIFDEHFRVQNTAIFPKLWLEVRDHSTLPNHNASHVVPTMFPAQRYRWEANTLCILRGQFTLGPMTINSGDPFGLFQFPRHIKATSRIIVYPATVPIYEFAAPIGRLTGGQAVRRRTYEVTTNAAGVREYAPGDSMNRIHWKTTARRGKLMVKDFELDPLSDVWIFIDMDRNARVDAPPGAASDYQANGGWHLLPNTEEYTVTCAASISEYFIDKGRALGLVAYTPFREMIQPDRGDRQLTRILELLALAKSETSVPMRQMLAIDAPLIGRGNTLIIITASPDPGWIIEADVLRRRGLHVIAVMIDPSSFGAVQFNFMELQIKAENMGIVVYPIKLHDDLTNALSYTPAVRPVLG
ncbi:MAG: DUF58 domain-containing protein [Anaerolineae bacterium]|nr:DUF58 domain-containing protein [Anaerolineae bacterium]